MTLLTIIQDVSDEIGLQRPSVGVSSQDTQVRSLIALTNREGKELTRRYLWQRLNAQATFTTVAQESQGDIPTLAPGFLNFVNETMWNRTEMREIPFSISPKEFQFLKAAVATGPYPMGRVRGNELLFIPSPAAGQTIAFEYYSENWVRSNTGTPQSSMTADTDTSILDEELIKLGVICRFKRARGLEYTDDYSDYQKALADAIGRDAGKPRLSGGEPDIRYGTVTIPDGSWPV